MAGGAVNMDQFEFYFKKADLDQDGRVSGAEAVSFFQASGLPKPVLAQIWTYADQNRAGYLGRPEFYNYLKLVTVAQSKQELTPNIVKAALYGPASAKIPPPQINLGALPASQSNLNAGPPAVSQGIGTRGPQGYSTHQNQVMAPPGPSPAMPGGSTMLTSHPPGSTFSAPKPNGSIPSGSGSRPNDSSIRVAGNGIASNSTFGDAFSAVSSQARNNIPVPGGTQLPNKPSQPIQTNVSHQPTVNQNSNFGHNQQVLGQNSSNFSVRVDNVPSNQSSQTWPKMSPTSIQKYTKVFMEVDTDRDGKITGEQARNLFLSWRLPREILKQVWDLSDQDNDSMLSLKEFCIALYLMERFREGRPLPKVLPPNIFEGTPFPPSGQIQRQVPAAYGAPVYRPPPGVQQAHVMTGPQQVTPGAARPPRPVPVPVSEPDEQIKQRKQTVPLLEKHLVDQLSTEEQKTLNSKFQEATEADKKVSELEKEILEARQKIEFYRNKMQEIVLYKSRCDSRLNEITERVSADRREVESLSKKYEDKYKQAGDVASKLTIEEATFRDIQDKKMELYRAIVKLEQDGKPDEIQARADRIQADLEEQVRTLNERCKMYGLRGKPTLLVELPFGWQTGIQEGAADWDENWDKFEDEGFTFVKELTLDVQNVIAPPKPKSLPHENNATSRDNNSITISDSDADKLNEKKTQDSEPNENEKEKEKEKNASEKTPPDSPNKNIFHENSNEGDTSPHAINTHGEHSDGQSVISGDKGFDDAGWGTFDTSYDSDAAWDFNARKPKEMDEESTHENTSLFDSGDIWGGLNPIRTEIPEKATFTFDSVPGTPAYSYSGSPPGENLFQNRGPFSSTFTDSVPSTPAYSYTGGGFQQPFSSSSSSSAFADSVPSTPMSMYATNSPRGGREEHAFTNNFSRFDSFSSSSNAGFNDGGLFPSREVDSFSRFDSFRSTAQDSEYDQGFSQPQTFARFDSMRSSNADSDFGHSLFQPRESFARFDSMRSTNESAHSFPSFDDVADPFGSHDPFKTGSESGTPRRDSVDGWKAF